MLSDSHPQDARSWLLFDALATTPARRKLCRRHGLRGLRELREGARPVRPHSPVQAGAGGGGDATTDREPKPKPTLVLDPEAARAGHGLPRLAGSREQPVAVRAQRMCTVCARCAHGVRTVCTVCPACAVTPRHTQGPSTSTMPHAPRPMHIQVPRQPQLPRALRRAEREPSHREGWPTRARAPCAAHTPYTTSLRLQGCSLDGTQGCQPR